MRSEAEVAVVTGVAGFIGSHLAEALIRHGMHVVGVDRRSAVRPAMAQAGNLAGLRSDPRFRLVEGDLLTMPLEPCLEQARVVFHLAARTGVRGSWRNVNAYLIDNVVATDRLAAACLAAKVPRLVVASSSSVYGDTCEHPTSELATTCPLSPYGMTKLAAEQLCFAAAADAAPDLRVVALRLFTVYGPRQRPNMLIRRLLHSALTGEPVPIYGDGLQRRDFVHVDDVVRACLLAMTTPSASGVFNVGTGCSTAVAEVVELIAALTGWRPTLQDADGHAGDVPCTEADVTKAATLLGYRPMVALKDGLVAQLAWMAGGQWQLTMEGGVRD